MVLVTDILFIFVYDVCVFFILSDLTLTQILILDPRRTHS